MGRKRSAKTASSCAVHRAGRLPGEVEVAVVREVDEGGGVGRGLVRHAQAAAVELIGDAERASPRELEVASWLAGRKLEGEGDAVARLIRLRVPELRVQAAHGVRVQVVRALVRGQAVGRALDGHRRALDAVRTRAHGRPEVGSLAVGIVRGSLVEAEHHVCELARAVRGIDAHDRGAQVAQAHGERVVAQDIKMRGALPSAGTERYLGAE